MKVIISDLTTVGVLLVGASSTSAFAPSQISSSSSSRHSNYNLQLEAHSNNNSNNNVGSEVDIDMTEGANLTLNRRSFGGLAAAAGGIFMSGGLGGVDNCAWAASPKTGINDGLMPDLPPEAQRSYLQYRAALQTSADYYIFEFQDSIGDTQTWGDVGQLFTSSGARGGQGQPNRIERDFINPMRILELSMPPDNADELRDARFQFERAMGQIQKATAGIRRDLPVEIPASAEVQAKAGWEAGRKALNTYLLALNETTGLKGELKTIPPGPKSPEQLAAYGRSQRRFFDLMKKTKLCQNRGGATLASAWGGLMVTGYVQDSCGIPDMEEYFFQ